MALIGISLRNCSPKHFKSTIVCFGELEFLTLLCHFALPAGMRLSSDCTVTSQEALMILLQCLVRACLSLEGPILSLAISQAKLLL